MLRASQNFQQCIAHVLSGLPRTTVLTLVTFSGVVSVYNIFAPDASAATVLPGARAGRVVPHGATDASRPGNKPLSGAARSWLSANLVSTAVALEYCAANVLAALRVFANLRLRAAHSPAGQWSALSVALEVAEAILAGMCAPGCGCSRRPCAFRFTLFSAFPFGVCGFFSLYIIIIWGDEGRGSGYALWCRAFRFCVTS
jgi:hypothetical protein